MALHAQFLDLYFTVKVTGVPISTALRIMPKVSGNSLKPQDLASFAGLGEITGRRQETPAEAAERRSDDIFDEEFS